MSMKTVCYFSLGVMGDGTSTSITVNFNTAPFVLSSFGSVPGSAPQLSLGFIGSTLLPSAIGDLYSSDTQILSATLGLLGSVTFSWPNAIPSGIKETIYGILRF